MDHGLACEEIEGAPPEAPLVTVRVEKQTLGVLAANPCLRAACFFKEQGNEHNYSLTVPDGDLGSMPLLLPHQHAGIFPQSMLHLHFPHTYACPRPLNGLHPLSSPVLRGIFGDSFSWLGAVRDARQAKDDQASEIGGVGCRNHRVLVNDTE